jgi:hypothetical protein
MVSSAGRSIVTARSWPHCWQVYLQARTNREQNQVVIGSRKGTDVALSSLERRGAPESGPLPIMTAAIGGLASPAPNTANDPAAAFSFLNLYCGASN